MSSGGSRIPHSGIAMVNLPADFVDSTYVKYTVIESVEWLIVPAVEDAAGFILQLSTVMKTR